MTRSMTPTVAAEIVKPVIAPIYLVEAQFSSGPINIWTGQGDVQWDDKTWIGMGYLLGIAPLVDSQTIEANGMTLSLSGVPSELIATIYGEYARGRPCRVWMGFLSDTGAIIAEPVGINRGRMDAIVDEDNGTDTTIMVTVEGGLQDMRKPSTRRYTHEDQQRLFPGDDGLRQVALLQEKPIYWGGPGPSGL